MNLLNIITRCSRPQNLYKVKESIFNNQKFDIKWYVIFDTSNLGQIDSQILSSISNSAIIKFIPSASGDHGHQLINMCLDEIKEGFIYVLDDDNILHENFQERISYFIDNSDKRGFIFNQKVGGKDFSGLDIRIASPENTKVSHIDMAQFVLKRDLIENHRLEFGKYIADGIFIENLYNQKSSDFLFIDEILCYYNWIEKKKINSLPRVLVVGVDDKVELKSKYYVDYESTEINTLSVKDDININSVIQEFNPDSIITIGDSFGNFPNLSYHSLDVRRRWLHFSEINDEVGEAAYFCASNYILSQGDENTPLISFFTPIYNTGEKLIRTYESVKSQDYTNWEWVLVNDTTHGGKTLKIAEQIADSDGRVKVYDFKKKSGGIVGESKYRAACLSNGKYIMELDHDDFLLPDAGRLMVEAFKAYPDAKFVYSDCAEIDENHNSLTYDGGFSFGYGSYRDESYGGRNYKTMNTANINPKTIRHIVGVPNHFRAWDRVFYHSIGGHNRRLTIADDYELIVRTFLNTKMVKIPKMLYLQFYHNSNTQDLTRKDIQRRVKTIANHYNNQIKDRFVQLGKSDWAYDSNPTNPLITESRFNESEGFVNYIFGLNKKVEYNFSALNSEPILSL